MVKTNEELIQWLKDNSSGCYRPSEEGAIRLEEALSILSTLLQLQNIPVGLDIRARSLLNLGRISKVRIRENGFQPDIFTDCDGNLDFGGEHGEG